MSAHKLPDADTIVSALLSVNIGAEDWFRPHYERYAARNAGKEKELSFAIPIDMMLLCADAGAPRAVMVIVEMHEKSFVEAIEAVSTVIEDDDEGDD